MSDCPELRYRWLGRVDYDKGLEEQMDCFQSVSEGAPPIILACEHNPVFTLGRRGTAEEIINPEGIPIVPINRGGRATYHGPGQAVLYPIIKLETFHLGVRDYIRSLEQASIQWLAKAGVEADRDGENPGVWIGDSKIAAVGVHVGRGTTTHGMSVNLDLDLSVFNQYVPCGLPFRGVTRVADLIRPPLPSVEEFAFQLAQELAQTLHSRLKL